VGCTSVVLSQTVVVWGSWSRWNIPGSLHFFFYCFAPAQPRLFPLARQSSCRVSLTGGGVSRHPLSLHFSRPLFLAKAAPIFLVAPISHDPYAIRHCKISRSLRLQIIMSLIHLLRRTLFSSNTFKFVREKECYPDRCSPAASIHSSSRIGNE
jgi:hypothetical protein